MSRVRVQKILARAGVASRRKAEELIVAGRVSVNGAIVTELGSLADEEADDVRVDGRPVRAEPLRYVLLNKPRGVTCTMSDPQGRSTVADLVVVPSARVVPVGRLDHQTSGVLLLTNDGELARALTHPSRGVVKVYSLKVNGSVDAAGLERLQSSIVVGGKQTRPADVRVERREAGKTWLVVRIHEGKNRQIRRLAEGAGYRVMRLTRLRFAGLDAEGLRPGQWRFLEDDEVASLWSQVRPDPE